jgi:hypothetical protein
MNQALYAHMNNKRKMKKKKKNLCFLIGVSRAFILSIFEIVGLSILFYDLFSGCPLIFIPYFSSFPDFF